MKRIINTFTSFLSLFLVRKDLWLLKTKGTKRRAYRCAYYRKLARRGSWIDIALDAPEMPYFPHDCVGVFISGKAKIGAKVTIYQNVGILSGLEFAHKKGAPRLGDGCIVCANALLVGEIVVGDGAIIGAGAVVVDDVPPNSVVAGNPARIVGCRHPH